MVSLQTAAVVDQEIGVAPYSDCIGGAVSMGIDTSFKHRKSILPNVALMDCRQQIKAQRRLGTRENE
jgi:hypothetical protein